MNPERRPRKITDRNSFESTLALQLAGFLGAAAFFAIATGLQLLMG
jgi:hypothetical protein